MYPKLSHFLVILLLLTVFKAIKSQQPANGAYVINNENYDEVLKPTELAVLLFHSNTCKYSNQLMPIYDAAADFVHHVFEKNVILGKINCNEEDELELRFNIIKYPTIKLVRHGAIATTEYRGQRALDGILQFIHDELEDPVREINSTIDIYKMDKQSYIVIGYFNHKDNPEYNIYQKAAESQRKNCQFYVNFNSKNKIIFRRDLAVNYEMVYPGNMSSLPGLVTWIDNMCTPLLRELTFQNAEEISEEGLPFVILFHNKNDKNSVQEFEQVIEAQLMDELHNVNFVAADAQVFNHPLQHLEKSERDLPLIVIDSLLHMYVFPKFELIHTPGKLKTFISHLHSGELHKRYHLGASLVSNEETNSEEEMDISITTKMPHKSKLRELLPSKHRYTFVKEEL